MLQPEPDDRCDVGELYGSLSARLEQIVRRDVRAPDPLIEDACQVAWSRLVDHCDRVKSEAALSWLAKTAVREAFKLIRRESRETSLELALERGGEHALSVHPTGPEDLVVQREQLDEIRNLPERQQRFLWLHALGLSYAEMALWTGSSPRTVERQLLRAKRAVRGRAAAQ